MIPHQLESIQYHYKNLLHYHQKSTWPLLLCCTKLPTSGESSQPNNHLQSNCPSLLTCHDAYHTFANLSPIYSTSVLASRPAPLLARSFTQSTWPSLGKCGWIGYDAFDFQYRGWGWQWSFMATVTRRRMIFANADVRHLAAKWIFLLLFMITTMMMRMKMEITPMLPPRSKVKRSHTKGRSQKIKMEI